MLRCGGSSVFIFLLFSLSVFLASRMLCSLTHTYTCTLALSREGADFSFSFSFRFDFCELNYAKDAGELVSLVAAAFSVVLGTHTWLKTKKALIPRRFSDFPYGGKDAEGAAQGWGRADQVTEPGATHSADHGIAILHKSSPSPV